MSDKVSLLTVLKEHAQRYPLMRPRDAVKLLYQNEFGGGHLVKDEESSLRYLRAEHAGLTPRTTLELAEDIGNGHVRLNLCAVDVSRVPLECVNKIFVASSQQRPGDLESFVEKLGTLQEAVRGGLFNFSEEELTAYLNGYKDIGYPAVSHSEEYRRAYGPAYRVIDARYIKLLPAIEKINRLLDLKKPIVVAIEGNAASGKTTSANLLASIYDANVIHMDHFFLPKHLCTPERAREIGGNIHYERFIDEVVRGIASGAPFTYRVFDCEMQDYSAAKEIVPKPLTFIEGVYSLHPLYKEIYDLRLFVGVTPSEQKQRILERNGEELYQMFAKRWIPMENEYFAHFAIRAECDMII
jgi:uridine kinase